MRCQVLWRSDWTARADGSWSHIKQISPWPRYCKYFTISRTACLESFLPLNGMHPTEPLCESCKINVVSFALSSSSWSSPRLFSVKPKSKLSTGISRPWTLVSSRSCRSGFPFELTHASHHAAFGICVNICRWTSSSAGRSASWTGLGWWTSPVNAGTDNCVSSKIRWRSTVAMIRLHSLAFDPDCDIAKNSHAAFKTAIDESFVTTTPAISSRSWVASIAIEVGIVGIAGRSDTSGFALWNVPTSLTGSCLLPVVAPLDKTLVVCWAPPSPCKAPPGQNRQLIQHLSKAPWSIDYSHLRLGLHDHQVETHSGIILWPASPHHHDSQLLSCKANHW